MDAVVRRAAIPEASGAVLGTPDPAVSSRLSEELRRLGRKGGTAVASNFALFRHFLLHEKPRAILLDDRLLEDIPLGPSLRQFESVFPVILLAPLARQTEAAEWVTRGDIEFVAREGDFFGLAAGVIERRLRAAEPNRHPDYLAGIQWPADIGEVFRHEINNPLTGILGNAELVLAHRERFSAIETQRLETVVDLAVRLRETIRRLSNSLENPEHSLTV